MPIKAVIFDYGNVLCPMPSDSDFAELRRLTGLGEQQFKDSFWRFRLDYDRATLDGVAYWRSVAQANGEVYSDELIAKMIATDVGLWLRPNPVLLDWGRELRRQGVKTAILSNMPRDLACYLRRNAAWLGQFDHATFSAELGLVKPAPGIYLECLAGLAVPADAALFLDDNRDNVDAARSLGIHAVQFQSISQFSVEVRQFGLPALALAQTA